MCNATFFRTNAFSGISASLFCAAVITMSASSALAAPSIPGMNAAWDTPENAVFSIYTASTIAAPWRRAPLQLDNPPPQAPQAADFGLYDDALIRHATRPPRRDTRARAPGCCSVERHVSMGMLAVFVAFAVLTLNALLRARRQRA